MLDFSPYHRHFCQAFASTRSSYLTKKNENNGIQ